MSYKEDDSLTDGIEESTEISDISNEGTQPTVETDLDITEVNDHDTGVRKRIDDLLEQKRLKKLLDDSDDW
jgi:hypothetical protein